MPRVRLVGLFLFMTAIFIALAAAATQTSTIRVRRFDLGATQEPNATQQQPGHEDSGTHFETHSELQFISVPIIFPLLLVGFTGLLLWFVPASFSFARTKRRRKRRRRKN